MTDEAMIDVVVVGSGFGGAVTACRLAAAGRSVCVLERGRRWTAPAFPRSTGEVAAEAFWEEGRSHGFLEYLAFRRFDVIQGAGVGGGSLHYFNVNLPAPPSVVSGPAWPKVFEQVDLEPFYDAARAMLGSAPLQPPEGRELPDRTRVFLAAGRRAGFQPDLVPLAIQTGADHPCTYCGNCLLGCNDHAKNTLDRNYLAQAERDGAEIRPLHVVDRISAHSGGFDVHYRALAEQPGGASVSGRISARNVIVAAGSLGSTELLLRSRAGLGTHGGLGAALGSRFSLNGEFLFAFARNVPDAVNPGLGPPITARVTATSGDLMVTVQDLGLPDSLLWFLEGAIPPPFARLRRLVALARNYAFRSHGNGGVPSGMLLGSVLSSSRTAHALPYLGMGNDSSDGTISLRNGKLDVHWDRRANRDLYRLMDRTMRDVSAGAGAGYTTSALARWPLRKILTAHPLGGCPMGDDPRSSVVDDRGRVHGHDGLFVVDGSIVPSALAVNPSLTIAALAERAASAIVHPMTDAQSLDPLNA